jgi:predicted dehydrogenase
MNAVRLGIIGLGNMGAVHVRSLQGGSVPSLEVAAVCDSDPARLTADPAIPAFTDAHALIRSGYVDAVLIATPHYAHTGLGVDALENGLHVLMEKPISVHKADCERLIAAHAGHEGQVFAAMFNQRTDPAYQKIRSLVQTGELGEIRRINWIVTQWFRKPTMRAAAGAQPGPAKAGGCCSTNARITSTCCNGFLAGRDRCAPFAGWAVITISKWKTT